ncbi:hypothetical protein BDC45DRAFT_500130 [Circinella umbellata]|nr:hypothetical protein BDC45DRAFT_500130 [Circinella umbellata]
MVKAVILYGLFIMLFFFLLSRVIPNIECKYHGKRNTITIIMMLFLLYNPEYIHAYD